MKRLLPIFSILLIIGLLVSACAPAAAPVVEPTQADTAITLVDGLGRTVTLASPAQKVVSLAPSNTEILFALGAGAQVVGRDDFSNYPAEALAVASVGGSMGDYNLEEIARLQPDLVLAAEINTPELVNALENLDLTVFYLSNPDDIEGIYTNLELVGKLTGRAAEADALSTSLQARVARIDAALQKVTQQPLVFYELDATDPAKPWTAGPGSFLDILVQRAKGKNVGAVLSGEWAQISQEELLVQNPDVILLGNANWGMTAEMVAGRPGWDQIKAVTEGRVYPINDDLISRPGPRQVDGLEELARLLHPQLAEELK
ncbi:MAG: cobalamin-binding protein [Anaerolineaceae bacterium]|jgi:iron complex transport system substrate-binding protein